MARPARPSRHRTSAHGRSRSHLRRVGDSEQFKVEDEIGVGRDTGILGVVGRAALCAVCKLVRNKETALAEDLHALKALIQARNGATARALEKAIGLGGVLFLFAVGAHDRLASVIEHRHGGVIVRGVEFAAIGGKPNGVMNFVHLVRLGDCARADLQVLIFQREGSLEDSPGGWNAGRKLDAGGG
jgi:hypothetical protein